VTRGVAWARFVGGNWLTPLPVATPTSAIAFHEVKTRSGWTVGVGTEYAVGYGWSLKSEFFYVEFDRTGFLPFPNREQPRLADFNIKIPLQSLLAAPGKPAGALSGRQNENSSANFEPRRPLGRLIIREEGAIMNKFCRFATTAAVVIAASAFVTEASANPFAWLGFGHAATDNGNQVRADLRRRVVEYPSNEAPGTIIIDTPNTYLYYVLPGGKAIRYGVGVGREGFTWSGVKTVERKAEWPDWTPPAEMIARAPYLPRFMAGGAANPLGARAMYLSGTFYRIHGTNAPSTIGSRATAGCIRMVNEDVIDLYDRVKVGTKVVVLPVAERQAAAGFNWFR
jgi:lipoprotein-anchoring transpeptidase ErfK/SrfK